MYGGYLPKPEEPCYKKSTCFLLSRYLGPHGSVCVGGWLTDGLTDRFVVCPIGVDNTAWCEAGDSRTLNPKP